MIALLCAALSGAMFYFSQGQDDIWWLAWFAPVPLLWLAYGETRRWPLFAAAVAAYAAGQVYFLQVYIILLWPTLLAAMFGSGALFAGAILFARHVQHTLSSAAALFAFPALWTGLEYLESWVSPHGSWGALGYSQGSFPAAIQVASLFGIYAVTFTLCLFANTVALSARGSHKAGAAGILVCAVSILFGLARLAAPQAGTERVAALADEGPAYIKAIRTGDPTAAQVVTRGYADAVRTEANKGAHVFVTPEGSLAASRAAVLAPLAAAARDTDSVIVAGGLLHAPERDMAFAFMPDGRLLDYDKRHLLLPLEARFTPGHASGLLGDSRAMVICKDMDFPRTIRADAKNGIRLMIVPAGDFMKDDWIHARMAILRGVENGFAVVRSAFNGLETVSDAQGRVLARARIDHPGLIVARAEVPLGPGPTLYTRIGDVFAWACVALALGFAAMLLRKQPVRV
jgi:apolipoprotein N-acyltransferase